MLASTTEFFYKCQCQLIPSFDQKNKCVQSVNQKIGSSYCSAAAFIRALRLEIRLFQASSQMCLSEQMCFKILIGEDESFVQKTGNCYLKYVFLFYLISAWSLPQHYFPPFFTDIISLLCTLYNFLFCNLLFREVVSFVHCSIQSCVKIPHQIKSELTGLLCSSLNFFFINTLFYFSFITLI